MARRVAVVVVRISGEINGNTAQDTILTRADDCSWTIQGPLFPRHIEMLHKIDQAIKEADKP